MYRQCTPYRDGFGQATLATKRTDCLNRADEGAAAEGALSERGS
jgi:hypothetical protein